MAQDTPSRKLDQYIVRFPDGMRDLLKAEAAKNNRSLNAEIVDRLEFTVSTTFAKVIGDLERAEVKLSEQDKIERDLRRQIELLEEQVEILRGREDRQLDLSDEGIVAVLKSISAIESGLAQIFFFHRDVELDGFIADQARQGKVMTRTDAVEFILREYLSAKGYVFEPPHRRPGLRPSTQEMTYGEFFASEEGQDLLRQRDALEAANNVASGPSDPHSSTPDAGDAVISKREKSGSGSGTIKRTPKLRIKGQDY